MNVDMPEDVPDNLVSKVEEKLKTLKPEDTVTGAEYIELAEAFLKLMKMDVAAMNYEAGGPMDIDFKVAPWFQQYLLATLVEMLGDSNNYVSMQAHHQEIGPIEIVVQKKWRDTPLKQLKTAEGLLEKAIVWDHADAETQSAWHPVKLEIIRFLNRPRTTEKAVKDT